VESFIDLRIQQVLDLAGIKYKKENLYTYIFSGEKNTLTYQIIIYYPFTCSAQQKKAKLVEQIAEQTACRTKLPYANLQQKNTKPTEESLDKQEMYAKNGTFNVVSFLIFG
jgi:hypothetical protein